jgi:hypothetical protein
MPIYEYYCPDNHTIYQFYAKTLAQGKIVPRCPDNPRFRLQKMISAFAITGEAKETPPDSGPAGDPAEDARMEAAMGAMEKEFAGADENDPKAMARMMRRMSELTGEKLGGEMEEAIRKLEEGADPDAIEEQFGLGEGEDAAGAPGGDAAKDPKEKRQRFKARRVAPRKDPKLYDYE